MPLSASHAAIVVKTILGSKMLTGFTFLIDKHFCPECRGSILNADLELFFRYVDWVYAQSLLKLDGDSKPIMYGEARVVWYGRNLAAAEMCLERFDVDRSGFTDGQRDVVRWSLEQLVRAPQWLRSYATQMKTDH